MLYTHSEQETIYCRFWRILVFYSNSLEISLTTLVGSEEFVIDVVGPGVGLQQVVSYNIDQCP